MSPGSALAPRRQRPAGFYQASVGKKIAMAASGVILVVFVIGHFAGNLKVYLGAEEFNHYAEGLRTLGAPIFPRGNLLWIIRLFLLAAVLTHIVSAAILRSPVVGPVGAAAAAGSAGRSPRESPSR